MRDEKMSLSSSIGGGFKDFFSEKEGKGGIVNVMVSIGSEGTKRKDWNGETTLTHMELI